MHHKRYLEPSIRADLTEKMVFVAGPRQVGKSSLARNLLEAAAGGSYYSWDQFEDRRAIRRSEWPPGEAVVVLDELHKFRQWKRWLKGEFDKYRPRIRFLVTGSARLDVYRRGGDSLQGRYHHYRLHPFSLAELHGRGPDADFAAGSEPVFHGEVSSDFLPALVRFGGFPEPLLAASDRIARRWRKERFERFFREDVRDLEPIRDMSSLQLFADALVDRVAAPLSLNALREDLEVSHRAVSHWLNVLDRLYHVFVVRPYSNRSLRGLKRMPKVYAWDWSLVRDPGARFENLVAGHLLKYCHYLEDRDGFSTDLRYLRDSQGRELDFLITLDQKPWMAVEVKLSDNEIGAPLRYFTDRLSIPYVYQIALTGKRDYVHDGIRCLPATRFLSGLV